MNIIVIFLIEQAILLQVRAEGNSWQVSPKCLTANGTGNLLVDTPCIVIAWRVSAGTLLGIQIVMKDHLRGRIILGKIYNIDRET